MGRDRHCGRDTDARVPLLQEVRSPVDSDAPAVPEVTVSRDPEAGPQGIDKVSLERRDHRLFASAVEILIVAAEHRQPDIALQGPMTALARDSDLWLERPAVAPEV